MSGTEQHITGKEEAAAAAQGHIIALIRERL